ncbi:hypothetical protein T03_15689 [Trichinella britovi]|uniref:Uncharacterized protein n=1 Tax=Trichinella britovi TaxID=45882 RepID=A0A0V1CTB3_TRIBR|nr:hypothetical protein T03_15689 [Trichinella britovi]
MIVDVNKETINMHAYLPSSALPRRSGIFTVLPVLSQIKSARKTMATKAWEANEKQIYPLCLPTRIINNDYILVEHMQC